MKKGIIVLLIAVLVSGFAFAGTFKGSAGIQFGVDLDTHDWGFANPKTGKYSFKFEFDSTKVAIGEDHQTDVWAELAAEASAWVSLSNGALAANADLAPKYTAKITKANIHVGEITFGILNAGKAVDYAASYYKTADGAPVYNFLGGENGLAPGFTVEYKGWYGGFGATGNWVVEGDADDNVRTIWGHGKTQVFELADGLTAEAGGYAVISPDKYIGGGLKVDYAADKLTAGIAGDGALKKGDVNFGLEGSIYATYDFVRLDIYGASPAYIGAPYTEDDFLKLDAMISAAYTFDLSDDIALDVDGYVDVRDTLIDALAIYVGSSQSTTIDAFAIALSEDASIENVANDADVVVGLEVAEKVTYTAEKFVAWEKVSAAFDFSADEALEALVLEAGISSTAIVENATLQLVYKTLANKIAFKDDANGSKGAITASCTINF